MMSRELVGASVLLGLCLALVGAAPAEASCQSPYCQQQQRLAGRDREAQLHRRLLADPRDEEAARRLRELVGRKVLRERAIADHERRYRWEPPAIAPDLEETVAREVRWLDEVLVRLAGDDPTAACRRAQGLPRPADRMEAIRELLAESPDEPVLVSCLGRELAAQDRREEAIAVLRTFLDERPEPVVYDALIELQDRSDRAAVRELHEERARRRPDDLRAQIALLSHLGRYRSSAEETERAEALARSLLERPLTLSERSEVCSTLQRQLPEARRDCLWQLYRAAAAAGDEVEEDEAGRYRRSAVDGLAFQAVHARDWSRFEEALAVTPGDALARAWAHAVDFTRGEFCPQFLEAAPTVPVGDEWAARSLARAVRSCGDEALALRVLEAAGLLRPDGSDPAEETSVAHLRDYAVRPPSLGFPPYRDRTAAVERASKTFQPDLEAWARDEPESIVPWLYLAAFHEREGRPGEALASLEGALGVRPDDLDLVVVLGAAALRLDRPSLVRSAARRLRTAAEATARHRAEADYLSGRLALREGRWEEAADRLAAYFLRRLRFEGCTRLARCDHGLVLHLVETGDRSLLGRYLEARSEALAAFAAHSPPPPADHPCRRLSRCVEPPRVDPEVLGLDCATRRAVERLEAASAESPGDDGLAGRIADLRSRRRCAADELPDPESLFPDDELLALSWLLREVR